MAPNRTFDKQKGGSGELHRIVVMKTICAQLPILHGKDPVADGEGGPPAAIGGKFTVRAFVP